MMGLFDRHGRFARQLSEYIDGGLDAPAAQRLERHLAACDRCRVELEELRATAKAMGELPEPEMPRSFALSPGQVAEPRRAGGGLTAPLLTFGTRIAVAGLAVALAAVVIVDVGDFGGGPAEERGATIAQSSEGAAEMQFDSETPAGEEGAAPPSLDEMGGPAAGGAAPAGPTETPAPEAADRQGTGFAAETPPAEEPNEVAAEPTAEVQEAGGVDALTAAEIALGAALAVALGGSLLLTYAGRRR